MLEVAIVNTEANSQQKEISNSLIINNDRLYISEELQTELAYKIQETQQCIVKLNNFLNKKVTPKIGLVYIHQGYDDWSLQFTYGGYLLSTEKKIVVKTPEIYELKKIFSNTNYLQITSKNYQTTRYMNQLGPILHESKD